MSLVDYGSSSEEEEEIGEEEKKREESCPPPIPSPLPPQNLQNQSSIASLHQPSNDTSALPSPTIEKLPDASVLLASPSFSSHQMIFSDHSSRVAAAVAESASRKRESNGSALSYPRSKHPRGHLPHSRNVPDTGGGLLIPPQLSGRRNVVTEDIGKLFVSRDGPNHPTGNRTAAGR